MAVYIDRKGKEWRYQRTLVASSIFYTKQHVQRSPENWLQDHLSWRIRIQDQRQSSQGRSLQSDARRSQHPRQSKELPCVPGEPASHRLAEGRMQLNLLHYRET
jgi:Cft2 family RNA processing exonuclease